MDIDSLRTKYEAIRDEYDRNKASLSWQNMHWEAGYNLQNEARDIGWKVVPLINRNTYSDSLPILVNALKEIGTRRAGLLSLEPGAELPWHKDYDEPNDGNNIVIRVLWGLDVPIQEGRKSFIEFRNGVEIFQNNELVMFSSLEEHRVFNGLSERRIVVGFDI